MKHEILKKTLIYRLLAYGVTILVNLSSPLGTALSIMFATISEVVSLFIYYIYEYSWRNLIKRRKLKAGMGLFILEERGRHNWYEVVEVLEDNRIVIKVV